MSESIADLRRDSRVLADGRLFATLQAVSRDVSRPTELRTAALDVMVGYAVPAVSVIPVSEGAPDSDTLVVFAFGGVPARLSGAVPLPTNIEVTAHDALSEIVMSGAGPVAAHATRLLKAFDSYRRVSLASIVDKSRITLTYICGNRFRVRNSNTVPLRLTFDVYNSGRPSRVILFDQRRPPEPYADGFFEAGVKGTVRLFLNGLLIQTKANGNLATCPR